MALHLDRCGHSVTLVPRRMEHALEIASSRENRDYLPGYKLPQRIQIGCEVAPVLMEAEVVFLACPSKALRALCDSIKPHLAAARQLKLCLTLCKGLELETFKTPAEIVGEAMPGVACGVLSGPTFAGEVADGKPTAVVLAVAFLALGKLIMFGTGETFSESGIGFSNQLIGLYAATIGTWARPIILTAAFATMFSTTLTCLDAYPRSISAIQGLLQGKDRGDAAPGPQRRRLALWVVLHFLASVLALLVASSGGVGVKDFVFGAMTGSFVTAPLFAWMAMDTMNSSLVPAEHRYGVWMRALCWIGLAFFVVFTCVFIAYDLLGLVG